MGVSDIASWIRYQFDADNNYDKGRYKDSWHIGLCIIALILAIISMFRMFDNCFWGDEVYSINASKMSIPEIINYCITFDANPFLYYILLRGICMVFGWCPFSYHFSALLPYLGILLLSVTVVYKTFGKTASLTLMILSSFLTSALFFIPEARMYELGAFTTLASYLSLYFVLKEGKAKHYVLFAISTVCASMTHYYSLIAVAFMYLVLILDLLIRERERISRNKKLILLAVVIAACCCAPILYERFTTVTGDFWITSYLTFEESLAYLFNCDRSKDVFMIALGAVSVALLRQFLNNENRRKGLVKFIRNVDFETVWVIAGLLAILGPILIGLYISKNFTPILISRYLFPISIIAWMLLAFGLSRCDIFRLVKGGIPFAVAIMLLFAGVPNYVIVTNEEHNNEVSHNAIMDLTQPYIDDGYIILTDVVHFDTNVLDYYYPGNTHILIKDYKVPTLDHSKKYLLYVEYFIQWRIHINLEAQGYAENELIHGKFATAYTLYVYELVPI